MRRLIAISLPLALVLAACGQASSSSSSFKGEEKAVADVIEDLQSAGQRREGDRICKELLASELIDALEQGGVNCTKEMETALKEADDTALDVTGVTVDGDRATAVVKGKDGSKTRTAEFTLVKERGAWRISELG